MNTRKENESTGHNFINLLRNREAKDVVARAMQHRLHVTDSFVHRLILEKQLEGHTGCVNCLEWNESGRILASASDDLHVILWDPFTHKNLRSIHSGHHGNIFSVKFMPKSEDNILVTGAGDCRIRVHDVEKGETTQSCSCHTGRVKRLATAPNVPFLFWSAAEDGSIMQHDLRTPHTCSKDADNVLVNLMDHLGRYAEAKCLAINPRRPELLAVGANDPFVRVYDRRMLKPFSREAEEPQRDSSRRSSRLATKELPNLDDSHKLPQGCVQYFVAGHLPNKEQDQQKRFRTFACTYLTFGNDGNELLVNLGGEQIYLFDINNKRKPKTFSAANMDGSTTSNGFKADIKVNVNGLLKTTPDKADKLSAKAEILKAKANEAFEKKNYTLAITLYNLAIANSPESAVLYGNRSAGYMMRMWDGDIYAALRDCLETIKHDEMHWKAHLRLARCLFELRWFVEAEKCLKYFKTKFPQNAKDYSCIMLEKEIKKVKKNKPSAKEESNADEESSSNECDHTTYPVSAQEAYWRANAYDYEVRFCGHCNTTTDIKECNFFGSENQFVVAGSDDGSFFIWDRQTTNIVRILRGDESIVNCLQPHPSYCMLATSGIDPVVCLWSPGPEDGSRNEREVLDLDTAASANQKRMNADPFEVILLNMGVPIGQGDPTAGDSPIQCRPS